MYEKSVSPVLWISLQHVYRSLGVGPTPKSLFCITRRRRRRFYSFWIVARDRDSASKRQELTNGAVKKRGRDKRLPFRNNRVILRLRGEEEKIKMSISSSMKFNFK